MEAERWFERRGRTTARRTRFSPLAQGFDFTETPVFDAAVGRLLFSDVRRGGVWERRPDGSIAEIVPHRRGIGGLVVNDDGAIVVGGRNVAAKMQDGRTQYLFEPSQADRALFGFNGMCADDVGRIYVGGLAWNPFLPPTAGAAGGVYAIEPDGTHRSVYADVILPNGMAYDEGRGALYVCDSERKCVVVLDRGANGELEFNEQLDLGGIKPDGMALGNDGSLFIACVEEGFVMALSPEGTVVDRIPTPVQGVTSVCFGFDALDLLCITGGELDRSDAGGLWVADVDRVGARRHMSSIDLQ